MKLLTVNGDLFLEKRNLFIEGNIDPSGFSQQYKLQYLHTFFSALEKLLKRLLTSSFLFALCTSVFPTGCQCVCPSVLMEQLSSHWKNFHDIS